MIPTTYKTEAEALAIRTAYVQGTQAATSMTAPGSTTTNASLGGVLSATAIERIQTTNLTGVTSTISTTVSGGFTATDAAYIDGMRTRLTDAIAEYYADKPNLSPFAANNKQSGQTDANVRDNFIQVIFKYDPRYGQRLRLSETESFLYKDTGSYQLPNRNSFIFNPYVEATMRVHGATDITVIDDTGTDGRYRITTNKPHGLYTGQLISADRTVTPIPSVDTHSLRVVSSLTQETATSTTAPTNSYYTTTGNHNFVQGQRFVPEDTDLGLVGGNFDSNNVFLGYQRERFVKPLTATTFELHRNYACTDRITAGFYNGSANHSQSGTGPYLVSGVTMQAIDGVPILFDPISGTNTAVAVFQRDIVSSVDITTGVFTTSAAIEQGIQDGMLTNFNGFPDTQWSGIDQYDRPLYFKKVSANTFTLHTSPTTLTGATLWRPGTSGTTDDLDAIQYTSSTWTLTFLRPHNLIHGQDFRLQSVGAEFGGQQIATYTYSGAGTAYWTMDTTSDNVMDGTRVVIANNTTTGPGATFDINGVEQTMPTNLYVKERANPKELELYTDAGLTTRWEPYTVNGTHTVETDTFLCNVYYAKVNSATVVELYSEPTITTKWNPNGGSGSVTAITSGATGNTIATRYVTTRTPPTAGGYIQPMFFPKTEGYTYISLYKDAALTQLYQLAGGGVVTSGSMSGGPSIGLGGLEPGSPSLTVDNYEATPTCYRMNNISHRFVMTDAGNGSGTALNTLVFAGTPSILPAYYIAKITGSDTVIELYIDSALATPVRSGGGSPNAPVIATAGTTGGVKASIYQQAGNYRLDKIIGRNMGLLTYYYNDYTLGTAPVNAQVSGTWYPSHYETNLVHDYAGEPLNWPSITTEDYRLTSAGVYQGHLRPCKGMAPPVSNDSVTGRVGVDNTLNGVTDGSPSYYALNRPGRFTSSSPFILGIKVQDNVGTAPAEDPLSYNGAQWDQGSEGQEYRIWPDTIAPQTLTWTIEQPTQVLETVNMNRYTRTRDLSQYRLKLTYPPMTSGQIQEYIAVIHAARGAAKPFRFYMPRSNLIPVTISMQNKSVQMPANMFVRSNLTAGTRILEVDGLPPNKTEQDPALFNGCGLNMRLFNAMGSMMVPISNVRTNAYGEANIRINNGIPTDIDVGHWFDSFIIYLDVFIDGNSIDIKVDTRGFHYLEVDMVTKRVF